MKRLTIAIFGLCLTIAASAQIVQENELALVYYMPENQLVFDIEYTEETLEAGPFFLFAEKYLGTEDVIQENRTIYHLTDVQAHLVTHPDYTRAYKVVPEKGMQTQLLSLSKDGLLYGYNVCPPVNNSVSCRSCRSNSLSTNSIALPSAGAWSISPPSIYIRVSRIR